MTAVRRCHEAVAFLCALVCLAGVVFSILKGLA